MSNETIEQQETERETISVPALDYDIYRGELTDLELTAEQENELLTILWEIMKTMVDLNLDMDAVQMVMPPSLYKVFNDETDHQPDRIEQPSNQASQTDDMQNDTGSKPHG